MLQAFLPELRGPLGKRGVLRQGLREGVVLRRCRRGRSGRGEVDPGVSRRLRWRSRAGRVRRLARCRFSGGRAPVGARPPAAPDAALLRRASRRPRGRRPRRRGGGGRRRAALPPRAGGRRVLSGARSGEGRLGRLRRGARGARRALSGAHSRAGKPGTSWRQAPVLPAPHAGPRAESARFPGGRHLCAPGRPPPGRSAAFWSIAFSSFSRRSARGRPGTTSSRRFRSRSKRSGVARTLARR